MPDDPLIDVHGVALRRPGALILREVSLTVRSGEAIGLFGANGSGKTSLLRVLATLERPSGGNGAVLGALLGTTEVEAVRPRIGLVGHEPALRDNLTLAENLHLFAALGGRRRSDADAALASVGLGAAASRRAGACSNGMRRRAEFARVALVGPHLLLLDEAHVGLDPAAGVLVERLVDETTSRGGAVVVVSHERERIRSLVNRSVTLVDGHLEDPT